MKTLYSTHPHFVRCIIPNELKTPGKNGNNPSQPDMTSEIFSMVCFYDILTCQALECYNEVFIDTLLPRPSEPVLTLFLTSP